MTNREGQDLWLALTHRADIHRRRRLHLDFDLISEMGSDRLGRSVRAALPRMSLQCIKSKPDRGMSPVRSMEALPGPSRGTVSYCLSDPPLPNRYLSKTNARPHL